MTPAQVKKYLFALVLLIALTVGGILRAGFIKHPASAGQTMGTSYSIKITGKVKKAELEEINTRIREELAEVNRQMSTWDPQSEISQFNHSGAEKGFQCSEAFALVVRRALELSRESGGAFDPTLQPLLNLWGFGSEAEEDHVPSDAEIAEAKALTGWDKLRVDQDNRLWKTQAELSLALGAIAKGYGVDAVGAVLDEAGQKNWFVEIGGEVLAKGHNPDGVPWRIGIQFPTSNPMDSRLQGIVNVDGGAVATSGDYRNYIEEDGAVYSHILDPRTGRTVRSDTASVTVTAENCMDADGLATALFVMGPDDGIEWIEQLAGVEAMFLVRGPGGEIAERFSSGFVEAAGYSAAH